MKADLFFNLAHKTPPPALFFIANSKGRLLPMP